MRRWRGVAWLGLLLTLRPALAADPPTPEAAAFFENEVRPLLVRRCQECHGASKQKGGLRLDSPEAVRAGGSTGPAVVPGKPDDSLLIDAINYGDLYQMPPKSKLPPAEIAILTRWVELGAPWPSTGTVKPAAAHMGIDLKERARHWSFQPLKPDDSPPVQRADWPRTSLDRYILAALDAQGLTPAPEADRRTLIRRVTFDLIGLPPAPAEIDAFLTDDRPDAYERLVDRLLASPHHGERWARHWLDLVRYAETAGHEFDYNLLDAHQYRDYVVRALNADLPYDQFVTEHVAGDLLDHPRRHPGEEFNESVLGTGFFLLGEGTHSPVDVAADASDRVANQIDVFSKTFLGLTVACARCHDHKFDPITTRDYYALAGYLRSSRHQHTILDPHGRIAAGAAELDRLRREIAGLTPTPSLEQAPEDSARVFARFSGSTFAPWFVSGEAFGSRPSQAGDFLIQGARALFVRPGLAHSGLRSDRLQGVLRSPAFTIEHKFIHYLAAGRQGRVNLVVEGFEKIRNPIYGRLTFEANSDDQLHWHTQDVSMWLGHKAYIELADGGAVSFLGGQTSYVPGGGFLAVDEVRFSDEGPPAGGTGSLVVGSVVLPPEAESLVRRSREVESALPEPALALALCDGTGEDERVQIRGSHLTLGEPAPRRFLEVFAGPDAATPEHGGSGRLELARSLVADARPLLARVIVNRLWQHHFGVGIVKSADDFGHMGEPPSHPELLDHLAGRLAREGWSLKRMHREMVCSSTYRMASRPEPAAERLDPANRLLHRMNVRRLEAEALRDAILAVSGRLDVALYGPSVPPHLTPFLEGRGRPSTSGPLDGQGRRSLYLAVRRNFLNPMFLAFDFPTPFSTMGRRNVSNVPAQALMLLNDPFVQTQARLWAERLAAEPGLSPRGRLDRAYVQAFGRPPTDPEAADDLAFLDDDPQSWADLCHVLMNVKEFLYIN